VDELVLPVLFTTANTVDAVLEKLIPYVTNSDLA